MPDPVKALCRVVCLAGLLLAAVSIARAAPLEFDGLDGNTRLRGFLMLPETEAPHRAVVFLRWGSTIETDPSTGEDRIVRLGSMRRLKLIFETNMAGLLSHR